ncbi:MAG: hypothetical protein HC837_00035 [Chloroflexaceae bacterium]|nr:hypothetical protein [Chloroflexaceae bacterium]
MRAILPRKQPPLNGLTFVLLLVFIGGVTWSLLTVVFELAVVLGENLRQNDLQLDYLTGLLAAVIIGLSILFWPVPSRYKPMLIHLWIIRCGVTLGFMLLFEYSYSSNDGLAYFHGSQGDWFGWDRSGGASQILALSWLYHQIFPDSYHAYKVLFSVLALIATYLAYRAVTIFCKR